MSPSSQLKNNLSMQDQNLMKFRLEIEEQDFRIAHPSYDRALFLLEPHNILRLLCQKVVGYKDDGTSTSYFTRKRMNLFNVCIVICIIISTIFVALDTPASRLMILKENLRNDFKITSMSDPQLKNPNYSLRMEIDRVHRAQWLTAAEYILVGVFTFETFLHTLAFGFIFTPKAYLADGWNQLDFAMLIIFWIGAFAQTSTGGTVQIFLRAARALRPLRLINRFDGMKEIILTIISGLPRILDVILLSTLLLIPFALYSQQILGGLLEQCTDDSVNSFAECQGTYINNAGILAPRAWENPYSLKFDDFGSAMEQLFEMATTEGWLVPLQAGMGIRGKDQQPLYGAHWYICIFFLIYMVVGSILTVNLFIGVIVETFTKRNGMALLTVFILIKLMYY